MTAATFSIIVSVVGLAVSIAGWVVVHLLALRTQKLALINSLTNEARQEITRRIRELHDALIEIQSEANLATLDASLEAAGIPDPYAARARRIRESCLNERLHLWQRPLEEFEPLFPETAEVRVQLLHRTSSALAEVQRLANRYELGLPNPRHHELNSHSEELWDLIGLTWDLLIHVQNQAIGRIVGKLISQRQVTSPEYPRLVMNEKGQLEITPSKALDS